MPELLGLDGHEARSASLSSLLKSILQQEVIERNRIRGVMAGLEAMLAILSSSIGSLATPSRLAALEKDLGKGIGPQTVAKHLSCLAGAFVIGQARRYDVKRKKHLHTPLKFYFTNAGLAGSCKAEPAKAMESALFNYLVALSCEVDTGVLEYNCKDELGRSMRWQLPIDFVASRGFRRIHIQSAWSLEDAGAVMQKAACLRRVPGSFKKVVLANDIIRPWVDEEGIEFWPVRDFLLQDRIAF